MTLTLQKQYFKSYFVKLVIMNELRIHGASLVTHMVKNHPAMWETQAQSLAWEDSLEKEMAVFFFGKSHGQRNLVEYSPRGPQESPA